MTVISKSIDRGLKLIVHLTNALSDASYEVHFSPCLNTSTNEEFAPIIRNDKELLLTPRNTPLILELAGTYRFIKIIGTGEERILMRADTIDSLIGDIK